MHYRMCRGVYSRVVTRDFTPGDNRKRNRCNSAVSSFDRDASAQRCSSWAGAILPPNESLRMNPLPHLIPCPPSLAIREYGRLPTLNEAQRAAAPRSTARDENPAPLLVIAGAGTAKDQDMAFRVAHLVREGAEPRSDAAPLTFSRRAAVRSSVAAGNAFACCSTRAEEDRWSSCLGGHVP